MQLLSTGKYIIMGIDKEAPTFKTKWCTLQVIKSIGLPDMKLGILMKKGSKLEDQLNWAVLASHGVIAAKIDTWNRREITLAQEHCAKVLNPEEGRKALDIKALTGALVFYGICLVVSCSLFILNHCVSFVCQRKPEVENLVMSSAVEKIEEENEHKNAAIEIFWRLVSQKDGRNCNCEILEQDQAFSSKIEIEESQKDGRNCTCEILEQSQASLSELEPGEFIVLGPYGVRFRIKPLAENCSHF